MSNFLKKLIAQENLSHNEMTDLMQSIMSGGLSPNYVSAILTALSIKGETIDEIKVQNDGSYLVDPRISIRELNTELKIKLPFDNAKTLNGLILEQLQSFPKHNVSLKIDNLIIEIIQVSKQGIKLVRISKKINSAFQ